MEQPIFWNAFFKEFGQFSRLYSLFSDTGSNEILLKSICTIQATKTSDIWYIKKKQRSTVYDAT